MPAFTHHLFVCCNQRSCDHPRGSCDPDGGGKLRAAFKASLKKHADASAQQDSSDGNTEAQIVVRANSAGCLDQCELGPVVVIYPQGIWYGRVTLDDVDRIVQETVIAGRVLPDLLLAPKDLNSRPKSSRP